MDRTKAYYGIKAISQSLLTQLSYHPRYAKFMLDGKLDKTMTIEDTPKVIGSLVDTLMTEPDKVEERYHVMKATKPTGAKAIELCDYIINNGFLEKTTTVKRAIKEALVEFQYRGDWAWEKKYADLEKNGTVEFLEQYLECGNKFPIDEEAMRKAEQVAHGLENGEFTKDIFTLQEDVELQFQFIVEFKSELFNSLIKDAFGHTEPVPHRFKAMCDLVRIDHKNKVIQPYDLKITTASIEAFQGKIMQYRYDLQAVFYYEALKNHEYIKLLMDRGYELRELLFIVESFTYPGHPQVIELDQSYLLMGIDGKIINGRYYKGINQLIPEIHFHLMQEKWDYEMTVYNKRITKLPPI